MQMILRIVIHNSQNDNLSIIELDELKPSFILSFRGRHNKVIEQQGFGFIEIHDPSWVLRGGSGVLTKNGSWFKDIDNQQLDQIVESYIGQIDGKYAEKHGAIRIYLKKYYSEWSSVDR